MEFVNFVKSEEKLTTVNAKELAKAKENLRQRIKAYFARQTFQDNGYFYIMNQNDPMLKAALKSVE